MSRQLIGSYVKYDKKSVLSRTSMSLHSGDLTGNWKRCGLTSDFIAKYYSFFFPYKEKSENTLYREEAENTISFILNELVENTEKYSDVNGKEVEISETMDEELLIFEVSNQINQKDAQKFQKICAEILGDDPQELYIKKIEENLETGSSSSGLGYLTLINDYGISFSFSFEDWDNGLTQAIVQAKLNYKEGNV